MCNFYIGQKVVYVGPDRSFDPNPGKTVHTIIGIRKGCCHIEIDVGVRINDGKYRCTPPIGCGKTRELDGIFWKAHFVFRPLVSDYTEDEIEAVNIDEVLEPLYEPA